MRAKEILACSYGKFAALKAEVINAFVADRGV
jgi:hypothetical protein